MQEPLLLVNCKNYSDTFALAEKIARASVVLLQERKAAGKKAVTIAVAVPPTDIYRIASLGLIPVFSEHVGPLKPGATTGHIVAEDLKDNGATGSLINHAEDPYTEDTLAEAISRAKENGLLTVVCAKDAEKAAKYARLEPSFIAMEPPELIGGDISVSTAQPGLISETVARVKEVADIPVLVGAGVKDGTDVKKGVELGAVGILVASGVTKAVDVKAALNDLLSGFD